MGCLLFLESNDKGFNWLLFTIGLLSITLPNLYFARQFNHLVAQLPKATRQPEKWSVGRKLFWLITGLVPLSISILFFYTAFTRDNRMVQGINFGLLTLLISILMYRHLLLHWGLVQPENTQTNWDGYAHPSQQPFQAALSITPPHPFNPFSGWLIFNTQKAT